MGAYKDLLNRYVDDLRAARTEALAWWEALLESEVATRAGDRERAKLMIDLRWPCGPVSHPRVIAIFRQYYLECQALARDEEETLAQDDDAEGDEEAWGVDDDEDDDVDAQGPWDEPRQLLIDYLWNVDEELGTFMKPFVLIPIGRDDSDQSE